MLPWNFLSEASSGCSSELNAHQIPLRAFCGQFIHCVLSSNPSWRVYADCGTTTAKGRHGNPFFELHHHAFRGVQGHWHWFCLCPPLRLRVRRGVFHRREGPLFATLLGVSPSASSCGTMGYVYEVYPHAEVHRLRFRLRRVRFPSVFDYLFLVSFAFARWVPLPGAAGRVSRLGQRSTIAIAPRTSPLVCFASAESMCSGAVGRAFPNATLYIFFAVSVKLAHVLNFSGTDRKGYSNFRLFPVIFLKGVVRFSAWSLTPRRGDNARTTPKSEFSVDLVARYLRQAQCSSLRSVDVQFVR